MRGLEIDVFIYHVTRQVYVNFPLYLWFFHDYASYWYAWWIL